MAPAGAWMKSREGEGVTVYRARRDSAAALSDCSPCRPVAIDWDYCPMQGAPMQGGKNRDADTTPGAGQGHG